MQHIILQHARPGNCQANRFGFLLLAGLTAACLFAGSALSGCSSTQLAKVGSAGAVVYQDATSPAGQKLLADVTRSALDVGLDIASGNDVGAAVAGIQGAASAVRDYEGMPTAPSAATIGKVAAAGSGVATVAVTLAPSVETLVENAFKAARTQGVNVTINDIVEALAKGFDAVAPAKGV